MGSGFFVSPPKSSSTVVAYHSFAMETTALLSAKLAAERYHSKIPYIRKLPVAVVGIILVVFFVNALVWAAVGVVLVCMAFLRV